MSFRLAAVKLAGTDIKLVQESIYFTLPHNRLLYQLFLKGFLISFQVINSGSINFYGVIKKHK